MLDETMYNVYIKLQDREETLVEKNGHLLKEILEDLLKDKEFEYDNETVLIEIINRTDERGPIHTKFQQAKLIMTLFEIIRLQEEKHSIDYYAKKKGIGFERLAELSGISTRGLMRIRKGEVSPTQKTLKNIAEVLEVPPHKIRLR